MMAYVKFSCAVLLGLNFLVVGVMVSGCSSEEDSSNKESSDSKPAESKKNPISVLRQHKTALGEQLRKKIPSFKDTLAMAVVEAEKDHVGQSTDQDQSFETEMLVYARMSLAIQKHQQRCLAAERKISSLLRQAEMLKQADTVLTQDTLREFSSVEAEARSAATLTMADIHEMAQEPGNKNIFTDPEVTKALKALKIQAKTLIHGDIDPSILAETKIAMGGSVAPGQAKRVVPYSRKFQMAKALIAKKDLHGGLGLLEGLIRDLPKENYGAAYKLLAMTKKSYAAAMPRHKLTPCYTGLKVLYLVEETARKLKFNNIENMRKAMGVPPHVRGVFVNLVEPDSPASKAGVLKGDILLSINGFPCDLTYDIRFCEAIATPGRKLSFSVISGGSPSLKTTVWRAHPDSPKDLGALVPIPAGEFILSDGNDYRFSLSKFYIDRYEVTNAQFMVFHRYTLISRDQSMRHRSDKTDDPELRLRGVVSLNRLLAVSRNMLLPVTNVSWFKAYAYANWAGMRLPSFVEIKKVAWGEGKIRESKNKKQLSKLWWNFSGKSDGFKGLAPVGAATQKPELQYNCHDIYGNVSEWVNDWELSSYSKMPYKDPHGPPGGSYKQIFDPNYYAWKSVIRESRTSATPVSRSFSRGFRCAYTP